MFALYNHTLLRGYLSHLQALVRTLGGLDFERANHPDAASNPRPESDARKQMRETWEILNKGLVEVLGPEAELKPFNELARPGSFERYPEFAKDPFRITMKAFKLLCDKHRERGHPEFTLMASWDLAAKAYPGAPDDN